MVEGVRGVPKFDPGGGGGRGEIVRGGEGEKYLHVFKNFGMAVKILMPSQFKIFFNFEKKFYDFTF